MKGTLLTLSLVCNLIAVLLFGYFIYHKGGLSYLTEKMVQTRESARSSWFSSSRTTEIDQDLKAIKLSPPETHKGRPLMQVLKERESGRAFDEKAVGLQDLSNLLWAADGITRKDGRRTAPSFRNVKEFEIYIIMKDGIYVYEPIGNQLNPVALGDYRKSAGLDAYVATAPINLIYVADLAKINWTTDEHAKMSIASLDVGFIAENVALFCSSEGFASVPRFSIDRESLSKNLKLRPEQKIILGTTVGYPKGN